MVLGNHCQSACFVIYVRGPIVTEDLRRRRSLSIITVKDATIQMLTWNQQMSGLMEPCIHTSKLLYLVWKFQEMPLKLMGCFIISPPSAVLPLELIKLSIIKFAPHSGWNLFHIFIFHVLCLPVFIYGSIRMQASYGDVCEAITVSM